MTYCEANTRQGQPYPHDIDGFTYPIASQVMQEVAVDDGRHDYELKSVAAAVYERITVTACIKWLVQGHTRVDGELPTMKLPATRGRPQSTETASSMTPNPSQAHYHISTTKLLHTFFDISAIPARRHLQRRSCVQAGFSAPWSALTLE